MLKACGFQNNFLFLHKFRAKYSLFGSYLIKIIVFIEKNKLMKTIHIDICPVCGSKKLSFAFSCRDYYATGEEFELFKCEACSFLFTQDFPSEDTNDSYYDTAEYISHSNTDKGLTNKLYHVVRRKMLAKKINLIEKHSKTSARTLLEIGSGTGFFLSETIKKGWISKGVEKNKFARDFALNNFGLTIDSPEMLNRFEEASFGIIALWHVLEHLEKLNETLDRVNKLLVRNGSIFIAVPNANSVDSEYYKEFWAAYDVPRHLWHFTPDTMKIIAEKHGLAIEAQYPMPFDAFYVSILSEKYKKNRFAFVKGIFIGLTAYFKSWGRAEKSSSVIYVLKKKEILKFKV